jgi:hypothetical protein
MIFHQWFVVAAWFCLALLLSPTRAFAPISPAASLTLAHPYLGSSSPSSLKMTIPELVGTAISSTSSSSSSIQLSATTLDPTTVLSDILGGLLGSPAILLVPIGAALAVASLIAFFIVSYANPEVEDDEK